MEHLKKGGESFMIKTDEQKRHEEERIEQCNKKGRRKKND